MQQQKQEGIDLLVQGRLVWGSLAKVQKKNYTTKQPEFNPQTREPIMVTDFGLAIPKPSAQSTPAEQENFMKVWNAIFHEAGQQGYQQGRQDFAWKFSDGDAKKKDGTDYPAHYKGCIVLSCSSRLDVKLFAWNQQNVLEPATINDIKIGDYVQVSLNIKGHPAPNAGLYINPYMVCRFAFGEAIVGSVDPTSVFTQRPALPQGATLAPQAPTFPGQQAAIPQMPGMPQAMPMQQPMMQPAQPAMPQYQPNPGVLPQAMQQQFAQPAMPMQQPMMQPAQPQAPTIPNIPAVPY